MAVALLCVLAFGAAGCSGGGSKPSASDKCGRLATFAESARQFATFLAGKRFAAGDWVRLRVRFQLNLVGSPPDEIRDDVHVIADASSKFVDAGVDLTNVDQQRVRQASQNISTWVQKICGSRAVAR